MAQRSGLGWNALATEFRFLSAQAVMEMDRFVARQSWEDFWPTEGTSPFDLIFVSHRWEAEDHPDASGRQIAALKTLLLRLCEVVHALLVEKADRLSLVPRLDVEGALQAEEIARRIMGYGPFSDSATFPTSAERRREIEQKIESLDVAAFDRWLLGRIAIWVDYCCVPQEPRSPVEQRLFEETLSRLPRLLSSSTVVALRSHDDAYDRRAWCVSEIWLSAGRSFQRSLFVDVDRVVAGEPLPVPAAPGTSNALAGPILLDSYDSDLGAYREALDRWLSTDGTLHHAPPDGWSSYRMLQGSGFHSIEDDPNPARRAVELIRRVSARMIRDWWMSEKPAALDLQSLIQKEADGLGLVTKEPSDRTLLGLLLMSEGWIDALRLVFSEALEAFVRVRSRIVLHVQPLAAEIREILRSVSPSSPEAWASRLSLRTLLPQEREAVERLAEAWKQQPMSWRLASK